MREGFIQWSKKKYEFCEYCMRAFLATIIIMIEAVMWRFTSGQFSSATAQLKRVKFQSVS